MQVVMSMKLFPFVAFKKSRNKNSNHTCIELNPDLLFA